MFSNLCYIYIYIYIYIYNFSYIGLTVEPIEVTEDRHNLVDHKSSRPLRLNVLFANGMDHLKLQKDAKRFNNYNFLSCFCLPASCVHVNMGSC